MATETTETGFARTIATALMAVSLLAIATPASAQPTYDRRIEEAAIRMLQPKLGEIRGSFDLEPEGYLFPPLSRRIAEKREASATSSLPRGRSEGSFIRY